MPLTFRWCFMVVKFCVPLDRTETLRGRVHRTGDNGEECNKDDGEMVAQVH